MNIKERRLKAKITQAQLAQKMGVDPSTVVKWETGKAYPRALDIPKIADALGCSIDALFGREEEEHDEV